MSAGTGTNYPSGVSSFGVPCLGSGYVPISIGTASYKKERYFFVAKHGSDRNVGTKAESPYLTVDKAIDMVNARINWSASPWGNNDIIVISPGVYAENLTALPYGSTMIGLGYAFDNSGDQGVVIKPASGKPLDTTSIVNTILYNIKFESADTSDVFEVDEINSTKIVGCAFEGTAGAAGTLKGIDIVKKGTNNLIDSCIFNNTIQGMYVGYTAGGDQLAHTIIQNNHFLTQKTNALYVHTNQVCSGTHFGPNNSVTCTDGSSIGVDDNSNTVHIMRNWIYSPNDAIEGGLETSGNYANGTLE